MDIHIFDVAAVNAGFTILDGETHDFVVVGQHHDVLNKGAAATIKNRIQTAAQAIKRMGVALAPENHVVKQGEMGVGIGVGADIRTEHIDPGSRCITLVVGYAVQRRIGVLVTAVTAISAGVVLIDKDHGVIDDGHVAARTFVRFNRHDVPVTNDLVGHAGFK